MVKVQWESKFDDAGRPKLIAHPILQQTGALYGGRTEAMRLHHKAREKETIKYVDIMSLHP